MKTIRFLFFLLSAFCLILPLSVKAQVYGLSGFRPVYDDQEANDLTGISFRFKVVENESQSLRLIFCSHRLHRSGSTYNYLLESNIYSGRQTSYADSSCTTWPLAGYYIERQSSLRLAIPDYAFHFGQQPGITTGIQTSDPVLYPVQTYLIDNIPDLYKSDAISQFSINSIEAKLTLERGPYTSSISDFNRCGRPLLAGLYRKWKTTVEMPGQPIIECTFVLPDEGAGFITVNESMNFLSEFLNGDGFFTVQYWDFLSKRESDPEWRPNTSFLSSPAYDGNGYDFGIRVVNVDGIDRIEFSNHPFLEYIPGDTPFTIQNPYTSVDNNPASGNGIILDQNFPNPFSSITRFSFTIPSKSHVSLKVYDLPGKEIATVISESLSPGYHSKQWDASGLVSGVYLYRLSTNTKAITKKFVIEK